MNKIKIATAAVAFAALGGTTWYVRRADGSEVPTYKTAAITRASLKATVSATGTLQAVRTVQVGTQVSGQVAQIYVDFNDKVKKGQLLARIDPTLQQQAVQDAQAQLEKTQAQLAQAKDDFTRSKALLDARVLTQQEFGATQSTFAVQTATVKSAQIALDRAKQNLSYTSIYAPIDGVIVERNVDVGQTVAASLSAPQLFLIANDLSEMQILAAVDESDIGQIKEGQSVQFTVQSYAGQKFSGVVKQVRLQSTTQDNVVNYTAVISVKNDGGKLLPGMTATAQFVTANASGVLTVPNAALHIVPTAAMLTQAGVKPPVAAGAAGAPGAATAGAGAGRGARTAVRSTEATLWTVDQNKVVHASKVHTGLTDGQKTEVTADGLAEGTQVVTGVSGAAAGTAGAAGAAPAAATTNPFQPTRPPQGGGRGPGGL